MNQSSIVAPGMARRTFWLLGAVVLALHLWALQALSLPKARGGAQPAGALQTRLLPPAPMPPEAQAPPPPRPATAKRAPPRPVARAPRRAASTPATRAAKTAAAELLAVAPSDDIEEHAALAEYERWLADMAAATPQAPASPHAANALPEPPPPGDGAARAHEAAPAPPAAPDVVAPSPPAPLALPPSTQLSFEVTGHVKGFDYHARGELNWRNDGARYQLRQSISLLFLGSRAQQSEGLITASGLRPRRFVDEARKARGAELDFDTHRVQFSDGASASAEIGDGAQDRLSVFIQLGARIAAAPESFPPGTRIGFETVGPRRVDRWTFRVQGPELLHLPAGDVPTLKLQRLPQDGDDQTDELWLGTDLHYLPVRIRLAQGGGDVVDLRLRGHENP